MTFSLTSHLSPGDADAALRADVLAGLTAQPRSLPPRWFYDEHGSLLFDEITRLPEYYPTRAERAVLEAQAAGIAAASGADVLVELGSGTSEKTRLLLSALRDAGTLRRFVPFDVDRSVLEAAGAALTAEYPGLEVAAVMGDFTRHLGTLPTDGRRMVAFLGSTIGNLEPVPRAAFLAELASTLGPDDSLLLGTDLVKDPARLLRAYDDSAGVTAAFNRNVLAVLNRELDADFDPAAFEHVAHWDETCERIEMRLRSSRDQRVRIAALDLEVRFAAGEEMRTEVSSKFRRGTVEAELAAAGLRLTDWWTDPAGDFGVSLSRPVAAG
ncbi:L-histidine N(alpha)-methyltransferase [Blastococcus sp. LR1]|uniref:L-histidine N(alpha)-methyltransferase n=1 Tax=Blastococcus sp. LR1 TaxID=2877000 RepID=UPI001CCA5C77|nr:L-histidine N(alpha)-methyltransferase [Blastococcus sp. LR1]MCA0145258.1 L-histidine N(alpha)-methyltransferase [Blastococcus sp. LR1]